MPGIYATGCVATDEHFIISYSIPFLSASGIFIFCIARVQECRITSGAFGWASARGVFDITLVSRRYRLYMPLYRANARYLGFRLRFAWLKNWTDVRTMQYLLCENNK